MTDLLAITNGAAGSAELEATDQALGVLRTAASVRVAETGGPDELARVLREQEHGATVAVLGGDGSLHAVVACLQRLGRLADLTIGLVPMGTGNDFARSIGLSSDPSLAAGQLLTAGPRKVDLILDDQDGVVVNAVHAGLGAEAGVSATRWKKLLGPPGYAVGAAISGFTRRGLELSVLVDGEPVRTRGKVLQVAIGNAAYVGAGAPLLPDADPTDGLLDVAVSFANPPFRRLAYASHLRVGQHTQRDDVHAVRGTRVRVSGEPFRCSTDGEIGPVVPAREWRLVPGAVTMLLPAGG